MLELTRHLSPALIMDKRLLDIMVCPVSGAALAPADADTLARVNTAIEAGEAFHADGSVVTTALHQGLLTVDGATLYPVNDGIPMMMPDLGIALR